MLRNPSRRLPGVVPGFILLYLILVIPVHAQTTARIDSLQRVLTGARQDSVRVRAHAELCYFLANRDNGRARAHGRTAIALAKRLGTARAKAAAHASVGFFQVQVMEPTEGRRNLEAGLTHAIAGGDGAMAVRALRGLALAERKAGKQDLALSYYARAFDIAEQRGDSSVMGTLSGEIGHIHHLAGRHAAALDAYQRAQRLLDRHGPRAAACGQLIDTGVLLHNMGRLDSAEDHYARGLRLAWTLHDSAMISNHLHSIGVQFARRSDHREALRYFRSCLTLREKQSNPARIAQVLGTIGSAYLELGELDSALVFQQRSYALYQQAGAPPQSAFALSNIAKILNMRGRTDTAITLYERSRDLFEAAGDRNNLLAVLGNLAAARSGQGRHAEAIVTYRQILAMMEQSGNRSKMPYILGNIARDHHRLGQYVESMDAARQCLSLAEELGDKDSQIKALQTLAAVHLSQGRNETALTYLKRGLKLSEAMESRQRTAEMHRDIGNIHKSQQNYDEALAAYARALSLFEALRMPLYTATVLRAMADVYSLNERQEEALHFYRRSLAIEDEGRKSHPRTLGAMSELYARRGDLDSAIVLATLALELAREQEERDTEMNILYHLSSQFGKKGNFSNAYEFLRLAGAMRDSTMNVENLRMINEMEAKYSSAEKQKVIAQLEAQHVAQLLAFAQTEQQLVLQRTESESNRQHAKLIAQQQLRELERRKMDLALKDNELKLQKLENERITAESKYQSSMVSQQKRLRNAVLAGMVLFVAVGFLGIKRIQSRRREALLRAEAAEYELQAAEAKRLALQVEHERHARQVQRRYTKQLIDTQERERKRIAGELHDSLGQELLVIKNRTLYALQNNALSEKAREEFEQIERMATAALKNVRHISHDLRPYQLDRLGLTKTLRSTVQHVSEQSTLRCTCVIDDIDHLLSRDDETNLYRIVQESMNNVLKHSGASTVDVRITRTPSRINLVVSDNGRGIDSEAQTDFAAGFGLQNMRERTRMLGGTLRLGTSPDGGAEVRIELPIPDAAAIDMTPMGAYGHAQHQNPVRV